ncbi:uncharacterized protein LOC129610973 isoform X2 [Condylostylus longicornis]|uniref:uncharacterized protein LOC129610973 isoform X2 n=1 Tax=Condylostylus longicornis TaxID=2530218 RepID=UPI00244E2B72|nr:uncharacterized protein LOC129610973 isoform X2 [Condylostylus longicornis]
MRMAFFIRPFASSKFTIWKNVHLRHIFRKYSYIDKIDCFATELVREKTLKWREIRKNLNKTDNENFNPHNMSFKFLIKGVLCDIKNIDSLSSIELNIETLTKHQLNSLILATMKLENDNDFYYILKQCLRKNILPELGNTLIFLSSKGDIKTVEALESLYNDQMQKRSLLFLPYIGYANWRKGNVNLAIENFSKFYEFSIKTTNKYDMYRIFKLITNETFSDKGEAVLHNLLNFAKEIHIKFDDLFLLECVWNKSFKSNWFSDQNLSVEIFNENEHIRKLVVNGSLKLCFDFLKNNNTDAVYRLIELFLKHNQKSGYEECLKSLFEPKSQCSSMYGNYEIF